MFRTNGHGSAFGRLEPCRERSVGLDHPATVSLRIARRMSATLHRENMRAISKRSAEQAPAGFDSGWDAQTEPLW